VVQSSTEKNSCLEKVFLLGREAAFESLYCAAEVLNILALVEFAEKSAAQITLLLFFEAAIFEEIQCLTEGLRCSD